MVKAIIVDDEIHAQNTIESILNQFPEIEITDKTGSVKGGIESILKNEPELIFLDIDLPDGKGFDILKKINYKNFKVIFITAFNEYAIQAIKFSAFDYILKPFNPNELVSSVRNLLNESIENQYILKLDAFFSNFNSSIPGIKKLVLKTLDKIHILNVKDIIRCESDNTYTSFFTISENKIVVSKPIKKYDEMLSPMGFMRVHQSHLINLNYISYFDRQTGGAIIMTDGSDIPVSNQKRAVLMKYMDSL